jgi:hypothetical protein
MATWNVPPKLAYALFVAGDVHLGEDARPALNRVLESLEAGPPPAVELREWIVGNGRMGTIDVSALRTQIPDDALADLAGDAARFARFERAAGAMIVAAADGAALDPRAPWGCLVLAATMASASDGVVYDSGTLRVVPQWILENPLDGFLLGSIKNHVAILSSTDAAGMQTTTTLGLNKYGLFELELAGVCATAGNMGLLVAGLAQAIVDARPHTAGAWDVPSEIDVTRFHVAHAFAAEIEAGGGKTRLALAPADGDAMYWSIGSPDGPPDEAFVLAALDLSAREDEAVSAALIAATRIARNRLSEARDAFARRALTGDVVLVKKAFPAGDVPAYLWLRVEEWRRPKVAAIVTNAAPAVGYLGIGDRVVLDDDEIVDWRIERRSGE